jgi:CRISPR-associated protein Cmr3
MSVWTIEPRDPLIFRDGKPFNPTPGARAKSLPFPNPSTLAGAVRTRAGQEENGIFDQSQIANLLKKQICGPVLIRLNTDGSIAEYLFPAPADCVVLQPEGLKSDEKDKIGQRFWARPVKIGEIGTCILPNDLQPISLTPVHKEKPHGKTPRFWMWSELQKWLTAPANDPAPIELATLGIAGLTNESRLHVKIEPGAQTAAEGMLFQTSGLEFARLEDYKDLHAAQEFALMVETDAKLKPGVDFLGGERRMVNWKEAGSLPPCPVAIKNHICHDKSCRLLLATPALFEQGYLPDWVKTCTPGVTVQVVAAAVPRGTAVSGWDYTVKGKNGQKASRRLAPAGSVYFVKLDGTEEAIGKFVEAVWLHNISDDEQDRRDGFGLALLGVWDGKRVDLEVK